MSNTHRQEPKRCGCSRAKCDPVAEAGVESFPLSSKPPSGNRALNDGRLLGAGLDVLAEEPLLREEAEIFRAGASLPAARLRELAAETVLIHHPDVIVTPHIAYDTQEALHRILATTLSNIEAFADGAPTNLVRMPDAIGSKRSIER